MPDTRLGGGHPINFRPAGSLPEPAKCFWPFLPFLTPADESNAEPLEGTLIGGGRRRETYQLQDSSLLDKILVHLIFLAKFKYPSHLYYSQ